MNAGFLRAEHHVLLVHMTCTKFFRTASKVGHRPSPLGACIRLQRGGIPFTPAKKVRSRISIHSTRGLLVINCNNAGVRWVLLAVLLVSGTVHASDYNAAHCQAVGGTLNIFWQAVGGISAPCTGIEFTNGTLADAADGSFTMTGESVSDAACISTGAYAFTLSADKTTLAGSDTQNIVPMTLIRGAGEDCFTGHWVSGSDDYVATISAAAAGDEIFANGLESVTLTINNFLAWCSVSENGVVDPSGNVYANSFPQGTQVFLHSEPSSSFFVWRYWTGIDPGGDVTSKDAVVTMSSDRSVLACCPLASAPDAPCE
jgi:hypothetical protein